MYVLGSLSALSVAYSVHLRPVTLTSVPHSGARVMRMYSFSLGSLCHTHDGSDGYRGMGVKCSYFTVVTVRIYVYTVPTEQTRVHIVPGY